MRVLGVAEDSCWGGHLAVTQHPCFHNNGHTTIDTQPDITVPDILAFFGAIETAMTAIASLLPFGYAFGAGMVASVNPCGFLMLPAFGTYYLGTDDPAFEQSPVYLRLLRAIMFGGIATLGFIVLFGSIGAVLALGGQGLTTLFPWGGLVVGIALTITGIWLLVSGESFGIFAAGRIQAPMGGGIGNAFLFGIAYGIVSLSCTLPIFLVVVGTALTSGGFAYAVTQFVSYSLGMGLVLVIATISVALFRGALTAKLRAMLPYVHRIGAIFLLGAGLYLIYYWVVLGDVFG